MLFYPLEEQLDLPPLPIKICNQLRLEREIVCQEVDSFPAFVFDGYSSQCTGVILAGIKSGHHTCLIADYVAFFSVDWMRISSLELLVAFGSSDNESLRLVNNIKASEIQVPTNHQVVGSKLYDQVIQDVDFVSLSIGNMNERG